MIETNSGSGAVKVNEVIAGGGGGGSFAPTGAGGGGMAGKTGGNGGGRSGGAGGAGGAGGHNPSRGGGGGGGFTGGVPAQGGSVSGVTFAGGDNASVTFGGKGGFGGGGQANTVGGGGGGGYGGGGGGGLTGGGGGSYVNPSAAGTPNDTTTGGVNSGAGSVTITALAPPTISVASPSTYTPSGQTPVDPFAGDLIADANIGAPTETLTVTPSSTANGALSDPNARTDGSSINAGVFSVSGTALAVTTALDGLVFTPSAGAAGTTTHFTISDTSSAYPLAVTDSSTAVTDAPCFCAGTRILTDRGEVAVETLEVGDRVVTAGGDLRPIVWIGRRELEIGRHAHPLEVYPVRVRAGAFGRGLPHRDLWLSPQHAVFVEGALIPIIRLANGANVAQIRAERVSYFHVELASHDVILAEGLPAESFLDCGSRQGFANCQNFVELHPTFAPQSWDDACAPLKEEGEDVEAVRARLLAQAEKLGFQRSDDPGLHIRADGEIIWPEARDGDCFSFVLTGNAGELKLGSRNWRPADQTATGDKRHLGVVVREIEIDGERQDLGALGAGWHELEGEAGHEWRWTDGLASLPGGARRIDLRISSQSLYWIDTEAKSVEGLRKLA